MVCDPNLILYTCIARGTTILARFTREPDLEPLAIKCIEKSPPHHSMFFHTIRSRTYTFLIQDPFVYFAVFDEDLAQSDGLWFLKHLKGSFEEIVEGGALKGLDNINSLCLQRQCDSIFRGTTTLNLSMVNVSPGTEPKVSRNTSLDSVKEMKMVITTLLGSNPCKSLKKKKKKKKMNGDAKGDDVLQNMVYVAHDINGVYKDFSLPVQKGFANDRQKAKQLWRKHVWFVLLLDLFVCSVLFVIWLWVCQGFKCIEG
ncbi:phytolongin Phyl2.2-like [Juglans microcarpa x Juglans regia]|uniref:phytolongin Phyl2.2-like n=1 Tax=Juglans microcarpa x Juglans regia TaxID=2249226 RepID=UPI001B7DC0C9|nr:phytolongin Phyl2.2-like [Juglans microcarpa x Juglans regia]